MDESESAYASAAGGGGAGVGSLVFSSGGGYGCARREWSEVRKAREAVGSGRGQDRKEESVSSMGG